MLWSDVQVFDVTRLYPSTAGPELDGDCHEFLYCVSGSARLESRDGSLWITAGRCLIVGQQEGSIVSGGPDGALLLRVRVLPEATSNRLPPRQPAIEEN
jgi:hypothetical protein